MLNSLRSKLPLSGNDDSTPSDENQVTPNEHEAPTANNRQAATPSPIRWYPSFGYAEETDTYFRTYIISSWPSNAAEHMFWDLLTDTELKYDMSIHYDRHDPLQAVADLNELSDRLEDKATGALSYFTLNPESVKRTTQVVSQMKEDIEQQGENLFSVTAYITLYADDKTQLRRHHNKLEDQLQLGSGVHIDTTTYEQDIGLRGSGPLGHNEYYDRHGADVSQLMTGSVASAMFPYVSDTIFEEGGVDVGINLASNTPAIIDPFNRATGYHMLRLGRTGSGKTFGASQFLLRLAQKIPDMNMTIIDPMGDFVGVNHALAGNRILIDGNENINPLQIRPTPDHILERTEGKMSPFKMKLRDVEWFFSRFFSMNDDPLDAQHRAVLSMAVKQCYSDAGITSDPETHHRDSPTITDVREVLIDMNKDPEKYAEPATEDLVSKMRDASGDLVLELQPFKEGNRYSNLAKPTSIDFGDNPVTYIDMTAVSARSDSLGLMMQLLFSLVYQEAKQVQGPYMMAIDEAHKVLRNTDSVEFLEEVFRHGRHFDLGIQMISQTFEEFFVNESSKTIARQCSMVQLHQMERIDKDIARSAMGLNEKQIEYIKDLTPGDGDKNYSDALLDISDKGTIPLRVKATQDEIAVIDYDPAKSWREMPEPRSQTIKQALDQRNEYDAPLVNPDENKLSDAVLNEVMDKQRRIQGLLQAKGINPTDFLTIPERESFGLPTREDAPEESDTAQTSEAAGDDGESDGSDSETPSLQELAETDGPAAPGELPETDDAESFRWEGDDDPEPDSPDDSTEGQEDEGKTSTADADTDSSESEANDAADSE